MNLRHNEPPKIRTQLDKAKDCYAEGRCTLSQFEYWVEFLTVNNDAERPLGGLLVIHGPFDETLKPRPSPFAMPKDAA